MYKCIGCGRELTRDEIIEPYGVRCPFCNGRIFKKVRHPIQKKVKAL